MITVWSTLWIVDASYQRPMILIKAERIESSVMKICLADVKQQIRKSPGTEDCCVFNVWKLNPKCIPYIKYLPRCTLGTYSQCVSWQTPWLNEKPECESQLIRWHYMKVEFLNIWNGGKKIRFPSAFKKQQVRNIKELRLILNDKSTNSVLVSHWSRTQGSLLNSTLQKACRFTGLWMVLNVLLRGCSLQADAKVAANWPLRWTFVLGSLWSTALIS